MEWKVLKHEVRKLCPEALRIIQAARNVFGHVQRKTSVVQGMKQMHNMASALQSVDRPVDWGEIKRAVLDTQPPFADDIDFLIHFIIGKSGGVDDPLLEEFVVSYRNHAPSSRRVPGELFGFWPIFLGLVWLMRCWPRPTTAIKHTSARKAYALTSRSAKSRRCSKPTAPRQARLRA